MKTITGRLGQNIFDIAFLCYGKYDILKLMSENSFITDLNYSDFAGKTIQYTPELNNGSYVNGLNGKIANTGNVSENLRYVWDGTDEIWDGTNDLVY